ncbi:uncharacterized protein LOC135397689 [Ornithodoros turicata]|uniref:uncharacterized protein LOC135397689 n=1 Tax=Ornithodoros turicata TaxID=34597 RepID=UPI003138A57E
METYIAKLWTCGVLSKFHVDFCKDQFKRSPRSSNASSKVFRIIADTPQGNVSSPSGIRKTFAQWRFNRVLLKGNQSSSSKKPDFDGTDDSIKMSDALLPTAIGIKVGDVTYPLNDPTLPWRLLEYFAELQIQLSSIQDVEKRKTYSDYLFRKMNVYLYSIGGSNSVVRIPSQGMSPKSFMSLITYVELFLICMMCALLAWFVVHLTYYWFCSGRGESRTGRNRSETYDDLSMTSVQKRRSLRRALEELHAQSEILTE